MPQYPWTASIMSAIQARSRKQKSYTFRCAITYGAREKEMWHSVSFHEKYFTHLNNNASVRTGGLYESREVFVALVSCLLSELSPIPALPLLWPLPLPLPMTGEQHFLFTNMKHNDVLPVIDDSSYHSQSTCFFLMMIQRNMLHCTGKIITTSIITKHWCWQWQKYSLDYGKEWGNEWWHMMVQLAEALHCKPEGHGFQSRWCHWKVFTDITLPATLRPWLQLSFKQK